MAILLYANGYSEEPRPEGHTFTDQELLDIFGAFHHVRSYRLYEVPNTWCLFGENIPPDKKADEFNKIASDIVGISCFSPILFLHDTEINPSWDLTEDVIFNSYPDFKKDLFGFFNDISLDIIKERERIRQESGEKPKPMRLEQSGVTDDKRIIYKFRLDNQPPEFFIDENLLEFGNTVYKFLKSSYRDGDTFSIFADKNMIFIMEDKEVKDFIDKLIALFEREENYEACALLRSTYESWRHYKTEKETSPSPENPENKERENETE